MDMGGHDMGMMPPPPPSSSGMMQHEKKMMMHHMTFFWGKNAEILFNGWPDDNTAMYVLALLSVFVMAVLVECLSHRRFIKPGSTHFAAGLAQTLLHTIRVGLASLLMLALMSFNVGVFLAALAGHTVGFFFFASVAFHKANDPKTFDLLPRTTC